MTEKKQTNKVKYTEPKNYLPPEVQALFNKPAPKKNAPKKK